jgi:hypothetical protein
MQIDAEASCRGIIAAAGAAQDRMRSRRPRVVRRARFYNVVRPPPCPDDRTPDRMFVGTDMPKLAA